MTFFEGIRLYIATLSYTDTLFFLLYIFICILAIIWAIRKGKGSSFQKQTILFFCFLVSSAFVLAYLTGRNTTISELKKAYVEGFIHTEALNDLILLIKNRDKEESNRAEQRKIHFEKLVETLNQNEKN